MAPGAIKELLDLYIFNKQPSSGFMSEALLNHGVIEETGTLHTYKISDKGNVYLDMLFTTPMPERIWADTRKVK